MISSSSGYCYAFDVFCRKKQDETESTKCIPLGVRVIIDLLKYLPKPSKHDIFFDNYFTTYLLMVYLKNKNIKATGTVRDNRLQKCPVTQSKQMKKMSRREYDYRFDDNNNIWSVKWKDNDVCSILINYDLIDPIQQVKHWSKSTKSKDNIPQPKLFASYNTSMGGVDAHDQCFSLYRISIKGKKWWRVFTFTSHLDMTMTNAWEVCQISCENKMYQLEFHRSIVCSYLKDGAVRERIKNVKRVQVWKLQKTSVSRKN